MAARLRATKLACAVGLAGLALSAQAARADSITTGTTYSGGFDMLIENQQGGYSVDANVGGGNIGGTTGEVNGQTLSFSQVYCADLFQQSTLGTTYMAEYNTTGVINGDPVANAGAIAWLMLNVAPTLTTQAQFQGLQGLIWTLETPGIVKWDSADNTSSATTWFNNFVAELGSHTAAISDVWWISPTDCNGQFPYQGFVAIDTQQQNAVPEPASLVSLGAGLVMLGLVGRKRRSPHGTAMA